MQPTKPASARPARGTECRVRRRTIAFHHAAGRRSAGGAVSVGARPLHGGTEWLLSRFPNAIRRDGMRRAGEESLLAGIILFVTPQVVKLQYLGYAENTGESGAMEALFDHVLCLPEFLCRSFDFGTSAEGHSIDGSLMAYKESLGGLLRLVPRYSWKPTNC